MIAMAGQKYRRRGGILFLKWNLPADRQGLFTIHKSRFTVHLFLVTIAILVR